MQTNATKTARVPRGTRIAHPQKTLRAQRAHLRKRWEESRQAAAEAQKVLRQSQALVKLWAPIVAQALRTLSQRNKDAPVMSSATRLAQPAQPLVATARRVPWQRLQIQDLDGPIQIWTAPSQD